MGATEQHRYVRYQAVFPNSRGIYPGIFGLANGLAASGRLGAEDWAAWRSANDRADCAYVDPATVDASVYDREINPTAQAWFKTTATHLLLHINMDFYEDLLRRYRVDYEVVTSDDPGSLLYEDDVQIVVAPRLLEPARS
ncbi:hypothetical protein SAMN04487916_10776 [Arthrobacter sp. ov407]|uniref:hypothetical protein n=1 Tax=Arthrobacter sp. ov407 TaxID=1761748 RepID=UPI00088054EC|nr:hypothetical protein [Arthrobacter sp. ov407]SDL25593.1 hypothetical protein SAMN04487916_10776 [Arthrobacter sp. ov407]